MKIQNFIMWFENGLKAQKLPAQGIALGIIAFSARRPVRAKALLIAWYFKAFALTGRQVCSRNYPGRCPGLRASAPSGRVGKNNKELFHGVNSLTPPNLFDYFCRIDSHYLISCGIGMQPVAAYIFLLHSVLIGRILHQFGKVEHAIHLFLLALTAYPVVHVLSASLVEIAVIAGFIGYTAWI